MGEWTSTFTIGISRYSLAPNSQSTYYEGSEGFKPPLFSFAGRRLIARPTALMSSGADSNRRPLEYQSRILNQLNYLKIL